jgi:energy-coupling factor transport system permease protein
MIPLLGADASRLAEAQRTRPEPRTGVRAQALLAGAVLAGSLDRAMDVAATLEVRGFAAGPAKRARRAGWLPRQPFSRHDRAFATSAVAVLAITLATKLLGFDRFAAYPLVHSPVPAGTPLACVALFAAVTLPFCDRRGIER